MWVGALLGGIIAAAVVPALGVYRPELFPTSLRGRANGVVDYMTAIGRNHHRAGVAARRLEESLGGPVAGWACSRSRPCSWPMLVLLCNREKPHRELGDDNPEDDIGARAPPRGATHGTAIRREAPAPVKGLGPGSDRPPPVGPSSMTRSGDGSPPGSWRR